MIYIFRHKQNHDDRAYLDSRTKADAWKKLGGMSAMRGHNIHDYELDPVANQVEEVKHEDNPGS